MQECGSLKQIRKLICLGMLSNCQLTANMKYKKCKRYNIPSHIHALTFSCYKMLPLLSETLFCEFLIDSIKNAKKVHSFDLLAYVIMPDHVHLLIWPRNSIYSISAILHTIKQPVARRAINHAKHLNKELLRLMSTGQTVRPCHFWQKGGGFDKNICNSTGLFNMIEYMHNNPVRRGLIDKAVNWKWSSAGEWAGMTENKGITDIGGAAFGSTSPNRI